MNMEMNEILELMKGVSNYGITEIQLEQGCMRLVLKQENTKSPCVPLIQEADAAESSSDGGTIMKSPLVGTFYASPSPGAEPYVRAGDFVKKGQVLGIVEAMKLMNEIESETDGIVEEVFVEDEMVVEYGQPLFRIR